MHEYVEIVRVLLNSFCLLLMQNTSKDDSVAQQMLDKSNNEGRCSVKRGRKTVLKWKRYEDMKVSLMAPSFPLLKIAEVKDLALGVFEIKQAVSYVCHRTCRRWMESWKFWFRQSKRRNTYGLNWRQTLKPKSVQDHCYLQLFSTRFVNVQTRIGQSVVTIMFDRLTMIERSY